MKILHIGNGRSNARDKMIERLNNAIKEGCFVLRPNSTVLQQEIKYIEGYVTKPRNPKLPFIGWEMGYPTVNENYQRDIKHSGAVLLEVCERFK